MTEEYLKQFGTAREQVRTTENSLLGQLVREFAEETIQEMKADVQKASGRMAASIGFDIEFEG